MAIATNDDGYELHRVLADDSGTTYEEYQVSEPFVVLLNPATDPHARAAIEAYAKSCRTENPELATTLTDELTSSTS